MKKLPKNHKKMNFLLKIVLKSVTNDAAAYSASIKTRVICPEGKSASKKTSFYAKQSQFLVLFQAQK